MNNLYDVLEICLQEIENGADIDTVLFRYPEFAEELRPILEASVNAKSIAVPEPSVDVVRRNRARVMQQAAQMREAKVSRPSRRVWTAPLRRALVTLFVVTALFVSSTNLVRAASTTVPGDNLYSVKRTWEDVLVLFTINAQAREALEVEHENERLSELYEVFAKGRTVKVDFAGVVTRQDGNLWLVSKFPVALSSKTKLPAQAVAVGDAVRVEGVTQSDGAILAEKIELLPAGVPLPEVKDDDSFEQEDNGNSNGSVDDNSGTGSESEGETPKNEPTQSSSDSDSNSSSESDPKDESFNGVVDSINGNILVINGQIVNIGFAEINGQPQVGSAVKVEGYYDANGIFIVTKIEFEKSGSGSNGGNGSNSNSDDSNNDDHKNDDSNGNGDDSGGGSGSGGGGDGGGGDD